MIKQSTLGKLHQLYSSKSTCTNFSHLFFVLKSQEKQQMGSLSRHSPKRGVTDPSSSSSTSSSFRWKLFVCLLALVATAAIFPRSSVRAEKEAPAPDDDEVDEENVEPTLERSKASPNRGTDDQVVQRFRIHLSSLIYIKNLAIFIK